MGVLAEELHVFGGDADLAADKDGLAADFLELGDLAAFAVEQIERDLLVDADFDAGRIVAVGGELQKAHDLDRDRFAGLDLAGAFAMRAFGEDAALERGTDALARHLDDAELADAQDLRAG